MSIHIVLVNPEIPPNTGNIARSCAATGSVLHLVKPLGFSIDDRSLKRAGLDYWPFVRLEVHESLEEFMEKYKGKEDVPFDNERQADFTPRSNSEMRICCCSVEKQRDFLRI
ncbi:MAG: TrmH family RNA methyltransferase [Anaerovoracaceae bacterium]